MSGKIPATVVTGFLGAGKTTLIQNLLRNANGRRLALIINEFGEIGVDGEIVKGCKIEGCPEENIVELANGCICCTVADDFLPTMRALLDRPQPAGAYRHRDFRPGAAEAAGEGLQLAGSAHARHGRRRDRRGRRAGRGGGAVRRRSGGVAAQRAGDAALDHDSPLAELFEDQIDCADLIVLNKNDQMDDAARTSRDGGDQSRAEACGENRAGQLRRDRSRASCWGSAPRPRTISTAAIRTTNWKARITTTTNSTRSASTCRS